MYVVVVRWKNEWIFTNIIVIFYFAGYHLESAILNFNSDKGFINSNLKSPRIYIITNIIGFSFWRRHFEFWKFDNGFIIYKPENPWIYIFTNIIVVFHFFGRHLEFVIWNFENLITNSQSAIPKYISALLLRFFISTATILNPPFWILKI